MSRPSFPGRALGPAAALVAILGGLGLSPLPAGLVPAMATGHPATDHPATATDDPAMATRDPAPPSRDPAVAPSSVPATGSADETTDPRPAAGSADPAPAPHGTRAPTPAAHALDPTLEPLRGRPAEEASYDPAAAPFPVEVNGAAVAHEVMAVVVLPGEETGIAVPDGTAGGHRLRHGAGSARSDGPGRWVWRAPDDSGIHALRVEEVGGRGASVHVNVLVAHPRSHVQGETLHGYRIGRYRETPLRGDPAYLPPDGFVEVAPEDEDVLVTPHFALGQFLCKQPGEPRFVSLSVPLLRKLEAVLEATNEAGWATPTFHVMSGFRTPAYNRAIGNTTDYSRHLWGDAADIFVDVDGDGDMDDLNGDGRSDLADARELYRIVEEVERERSGAVEPGGLGLYRRNAAHGPFVHVDARGAPARW